MNPEELRSVREWLHEHGMEIVAMSAVGDTVTIDVHPQDGAPRKLHLAWDLLRGCSHQQIKDWLESQNCSTELLVRDVYIGPAK